MLGILRCAIILGLLNLSVQQNGDQQDQTLSRETIDAILQILSPQCREETEAAIHSQTEISTNCKYEIQSVIPNLLTPEDQELHRKQQEREEYERNSRDTESPKKKREESRRRRKAIEEPITDSDNVEGTSPIILLGGLVVAIVVGIIGIMTFRKHSKEDSSKGSKKAGKIEKKKVSKVFFIFMTVYNTLFGYVNLTYPYTQFLNFFQEERNRPKNLRR